MGKRQVTFIVERFLVDLTDQINEWIVKFPTFKMVDIKYGVTCYHGEPSNSPMFEYSALIIYDETE